jgi:hypothetical protein
MLRPSEFILATRRELILPSDIASRVFACFLRVCEPKTKWKGASKQLARCDEWWIVFLLEACFGHVSQSERLWPGTAHTFRRRWNEVLSALKLPCAGSRGLTPGGLRAGGSTAFFEATEDLERLRRRGRWLRATTVEIYVQEVAPSEFLMNLQPETKARLVSLSGFLPFAVHRAHHLLRSKVPVDNWPKVFLTGD